MSNTPREYWGFYLDGRGQPRPRNLQIDVTSLVESVLTAESMADVLHSIVRKACEEVLQGRVSERAKREWLEENEEAIDELGLDKVRSYDAWMAGRVDELTSHIELEVMDEMEEAVSGE